MVENPEVIKSRFDKIISLERQALLSGDFSGLQTLGIEKSEILGQIVAHNAQFDQDWLGRSKKRTIENQKLYEASLLGIRKVQRKLDSLLSGGADLKTYGKDGHRDSLLQTTRSLERRA